MLAGRHAERARIDGLLDAARDSRSGVLVLRGEPGIGKSALLDYAAESANGMQVLRAAGLEADSELAFAGLHQLLRPLLDRMERLPAPQAAALRGALGLSDEPVVDRFGVSVAVLGLLADAAEDGPLLGAVDDAQWLDLPSADALVFAAQRLGAEGIVLLFATREGEGRELPARHLPQLRVSWLSSGEAEAVIDEHAPGLDPPERAALLRAARGNPLALVELSARGLDGNGNESGDAGSSVERSFLARVAELSAGAQTLLLVLATDDSSELGIVLAAGEALGAGPDALEEVEASGLTRAVGGRLRFRHPLVRSAVISASAPGKRRGAHRALAEASTSPADRESRAWHLAAAAQGPDEEVAAELEAVATIASARGAHAASGSALERAAELSADDGLRARRLAGAAQALWQAGAMDRADAVLDRMHKLAGDDATRAAVAYVRGSVTIESGAPAEAYEELVNAASRSSDPRQALELLFRALESAWYSGSNARAAEVGRLAAAAPAPESAEQRLMLSTMVGAGHLYSGDFRAAMGPLRDAIELGRSAEDPLAVMTAGAAAFYAGEPTVVLELYRRAAAAARSFGALGALATVLQLLAFIEIVEGNLPLVRQTASEGLRLAGETDSANAACGQLASLAWIAAMQGREAECHELAGEALRLASARGLVLQGAVANWALGALELGLGRIQKAHALLADVAAGEAPSSHLAIAVVATPDHVEAAVRAGQPGHAEQAIERFREWSDASGSTWARATLARMEAAVSGDEADVERALDGFDAIGWELDAARTRLLHAERLNRDGRRDDALEQLRAALATFERMGADPWAARTRTELGASGVALGERAPHSVHELTPEELQIARLVSGGATNREAAERLFLSPRTIEFHVRSVFRKLGISSLGELPAVLD